MSKVIQLASGKVRQELNPGLLCHSSVVYVLDYTSSLRDDFFSCSTIHQLNQSRT